LNRSIQNKVLLATGVLVGTVALAAFAAPYLYAEYLFDWLGQRPTMLPKPTVPVVGRWYDDYFLVEAIDPTTFAIGEPRYYQGNYSYLILGTDRAILFDAGTGLKDIVPVVRSLTPLPVTVIPSHLHFDHVGALGRFERTAMIDDPSLRVRVRNSRLTLKRYEFLGFADRLPIPTIRVDEWWPAGSSVDLGGRHLRVLATPGHTPTSVSLYDEDRHELFAGDFIYPGELYAFLPGASRSAYLKTAVRLLSVLDPSTKIFAAHMAEPPAPAKAPALGVSDLQALKLSLERIERDESVPAGFYPRAFPVNERIRFATGWDWNSP